MTELVAKNCLDFVRLRLLYERVVNDDVFLPGQSVKVRIAMCASLASIDGV